VWRGEAQAERLDVYSRQRRLATTEHVQTMSIRNKRTLEEREPEVRRRHFEERQYLINSAMIASVRRAALV
jgi:3-(3-hydroxy-phenyl)propionate hydroxylase